MRAARRRSAAPGAERVEAYLKVFFDTKFKPRPNLLTQGLAKEHPELAQASRLGNRHA